MDKITNLLYKLSIGATYYGCRYIRYGLQLCLKNEDYLLAITTRLYIDIAKHFNVSTDSVDSCIRTAISNCWNNGGRQYLIKIARCELKAKPSNGQFFDILYSHLQFGED